MLSYSVHGTILCDLMSHPWCSLLVTTQRILLNNSSHFTGGSSSKHIIVTHENKVFYLGPVPQKMVKLTQNLELNFKHGFLV